MKIFKNIFKIVLAVSFVFSIHQVFACDNANSDRSYFSYIAHPTTVLLTGITSLGCYCFYDQEATSQTYQWLKERFDAVPNLFKATCAVIGVCGSYAYWFHKKKEREEKRAQEASRETERSSSQNILNARFNMIEKENKENEAGLKSLKLKNKLKKLKLKSFAERLEVLEMHDKENEIIKKKYFDPSSNEQRNSLDMAVSAERVQSVIIREEDEIDLPHEEHALFPKEGYTLLIMRVQNLEDIALGYRTTAESFDEFAKTKSSRIDHLFERMDRLEESQDKLELDCHINKEDIIKLKKDLAEIKGWVGAFKEIHGVETV